MPQQKSTDRRANVWKLDVEGVELHILGQITFQVGFRAF
jgi:hypothetical protein